MAVSKKVSKSSWNDLTLSGRTGSDWNSNVKLKARQDAETSNDSTGDDSYADTNNGDQDSNGGDSGSNDSSQEGDSGDSSSSPPPPSGGSSSSNSTSPPSDNGSSQDSDNGNNNNNNNNDNSNNDNNNDSGGNGNNGNGSNGNGNDGNGNNGNGNNNNNNNNNNNKNNNSSSSSPSSQSSPPPSNNNNNNNNKSPPQNSGNSNSPPSPNSGRPMFSPPPPALGKDNSPSKSSSKEDRDATIKGGAIVGGIGLLLVLIIVVLACCLCKKKKREKRYANSMKHFPDDKKGQQQYANNNGQWRGSPQHNHDGGDHNNYSGATGMSSQQHWGPAMPPPPPPMGMNSEMMSTGQYSSGPMGPTLPPPPPPSLGGFNKSTFTYDELAAATNGFSQDNILGQGGFGYVHKGVLPNGKEIAVKSLKSGSGQGEREFQAEVEIISRVHHRYLVSLVGYCIAGGQRMLVYEFIPNKTLEYHLHGEGLPVMDFATRMKIALGSAKGLAYLHEDCHPRIIHRDIKGANILIDHSFDAKVADFGLAKLSNDTNTHVSTRIMGTFGYLAPEYAASGKLTEKSDVFSFGVMLLELVTGKRPIDPSAEEEDTLVDWARPLVPRALEEGVFNGLVDPRLEGNFDPQEMTRLIACAGAAVRHSGKRRPKMSQIVRALEGDMSIDALYEPAKVGVPSGGSSDYDTQAYNNDMSKFRRAVLDSTDYSSSSDSGGIKRNSPGPSYL